MNKDKLTNEQIWNINSTHFSCYHVKEGRTINVRGIFKPEFERIMADKDKEISELRNEVDDYKKASQLTELLIGSEKATLIREIQSLSTKLKEAEEENRKLNIANNILADGNVIDRKFLSNENNVLQAEILKLRSALEDIRTHSMDPFAKVEFRGNYWMWLNYAHDVAEEALSPATKPSEGMEGK